MPRCFCSEAARCTLTLRARKVSRKRGRRLWRLRLLIDAEQPEVKLELGVLYYRLGSTEVARTYLQDVSSSKESTDELKERANTFLKEMKQP